MTGANITRKLGMNVASKTSNYQKAPQSRGLSSSINGYHYPLTTKAPYFTDFTAFIKVALNCCGCSSIGKWPESSM
ncbi:hypothetical protein VCE7224_03100 [Vibrio celticus]|uniref:Uncharacterized protein n=1 Tax=Vibrio celticus TaxID=446372 RepID=A0A1C3JH02_9VIBR|nr:hypothetical protein VCE7224_03100 [Vibrio celticus]